MDHKILHFLAIVIPPPLAEEIRTIQYEFNRRFCSGRALKSPPHLTLISPYYYDENDLQELKNCIIPVAIKTPPFSLELKDFDCFSQKVIFINPSSSAELMDLQKRLQVAWQSRFPLLAAKPTLEFHPHVTVAFKDLTRNHFLEAWPEFSSRKFHATIEVDSLWILKYIEKTWVPWEQYFLKGEKCE